MPFIKVVIVYDDGEKRKSIVNLDTVDRFEVVDENSPTEHVLMLDKNNEYFVLSTSINTIVGQLEKLLELR